MMFRFESTRQAPRLTRRPRAPRLLLALLAIAVATGLATAPTYPTAATSSTTATSPTAPTAATGLPDAGIVTAQPKGQIDCSKYAGTEKEACEKMMSRRRS